VVVGVEVPLEASAAFTARRRDAVEIDAIGRGLLDAVNHAVEPTHASQAIRS
jgi:stage V sporulation protein SpoVS